MIVVRIKYAKQNEARFFSHLDTIRILLRAARRADLPLLYSKGFSPKPKVSFSLPLPLGHTSETEYADFQMDLSENTAGEQIKNLLSSYSKNLPHGFALLFFEALNSPYEPLSSFCGMTYEVPVTLEKHAGVFKENIARLLSESALPVKRKIEEGTKIIDIRPFIHTLQFEQKTESSGNLSMGINLTNSGYARPEEIVERIGGASAGIYHRKILDFRF